MGTLLLLGFPPCQRTRLAPLQGDFKLHWVQSPIELPGALPKQPTEPLAVLMWLPTEGNATEEAHANNPIPAWLNALKASTAAQPLLAVMALCDTPACGATQMMYQAGLRFFLCAPPTVAHIRQAVHDLFCPNPQTWLQTLPSHIHLPTQTANISPFSPQNAACLWLEWWLSNHSHHAGKVNALIDTAMQNYPAIYHETSRAQTTIALRELLSNAVEHGNLGVGTEEKKRLIKSPLQYEDELSRRAKANPNTLVRVNAHVSSQQVCIWVQDAGKGFNHLGVADPNHPRKFAGVKWPWNSPRQGECAYIVLHRQW